MIQAGDPTGTGRKFSLTILTSFVADEFFSFLGGGESIYG
jgi:hypothetical protein